MAKKCRKPQTVRVINPGPDEVKAMEGLLWVCFDRGRARYYVRLPLARVLRECRKAGLINSADAPRPRSVPGEPRA